MGGSSYSRLVRLGQDGTPELGIRPEANGPVRSMSIQANGKIVLGGEFTKIGYHPRNRLARLNSDLSMDVPFAPSVNGIVHSVTAQTNGKILVGGEFTYFSTYQVVNHQGIESRTTRNRFARLNEDGTVDDAFNPGVNGTVYSVAVQTDGNILVGGDFTEIGGEARNRLARLNPDGSLDTLAPGINGTVHVIAVLPDGKILLGGAFTTINGVTRNRLARLNSDGTLDPDFNPNADDVVYSIAIRTDGRIMVGGAFISMGGQLRYRLARFNSDGSLDNAFDLDADNTIYSVAVQQGGKVIAGGAFTFVGGQAQQYAVRLANSEAESQNLSADASGSRITWTRSGAGPEVHGVVFYGSANSAEWTSLGNGTRMTGGWELASGLSLPANANYYIKALGRTYGGINNAGDSVLESVRNIFLVPYTLNASAGANGVISPAGTVVVERGKDQTFTITPDAGYGAEVHVDGVTSAVSAGTATSYTFSNVVTNHTITAAFGSLVTGACGTDHGRTGLTSPPTELCAAGSASTLSNAWTWTCNGSFGGNSANCSAAIQTYVISASTGSERAGGAISPAGEVSVNHGSNKTFTIIPSEGYHITDVKVDDASVGVVNSHTFSNIEDSHTFIASFAVNTYTLTRSAGAGGSIFPEEDNPMVVNHGETWCFGIIPEPGYQVADVRVDGFSVGPVTRYNFYNVNASHTIAATFTPKAAASLIDTGFYPEADRAVTGVVVQPDGKIIVGGATFGP